MSNYFDDPDSGILAPRCPGCGWNTVRPDTPENHVIVRNEVAAHTAVCNGGEAETPAGGHDSGAVLVSSPVEREAATVPPAGMIPGYFIAPDGAGDVWVWAENGDYPLPVVSQRTFTHHRSAGRALWDAIAAQLEVRDR